jgi:hypothetical protein
VRKAVKMTARTIPLFARRGGTGIHPEAQTGGVPIAANPKSTSSTDKEKNMRKRIANIMVLAVLAAGTCGWAVA